MSRRTVSIALKIPDNEAYTALVTLQRLGVPVTAIERSEIRRLAESEPDPEINPNTQRLVELERDEPRSGEVWIEEFASAHGNRVTGWRLAGADGKPAQRDVLQAAAERLLCNPAIERSRY
jgi:hypothetical protein